jgi:inner membrane protein
MDNLTHTLLGLSLAKAGLERTTPLATTALVISSNLPDIDNFGVLRGDVVSSLQEHRGFTHGFVGLAVLAFLLTLTLTFLDRRFRLRTDPFRRPLRPLRIFWLGYLAGLVHTFMDFTNSYGVRLLEPFSHRWFSSDMVFVIDPWIWLVLGAVTVWLTATSAARIFLWMIVGTITSLVVVMAQRQPTEFLPPVPMVVRVVWFAGVGLIMWGVFRGWGRRSGSGADPSRLAKYALAVLALYYAGMWSAHQTAMKRAWSSLPAGANTVAAWPAPADPRVWQLAASSEDARFVANVNLRGNQDQWRQFQKLEPEIEAALRESPDARAALDFMRFSWGFVEDTADGITVTVRDLRFSIHMRAELDKDLRVESVEVRWF